MKATIVPAQVTTVEDRIVGSLGLTQVILLVAPILIFFMARVALPPNFHNAPYKLVLSAVVALLCAVSAIRIRGTLILFRATTLVRYTIRPRYYVYTKHSTHGRKQWFDSENPLEAEKETTQKPSPRERLSLSTAQLIHLEGILHNPAAAISYEFKKGALSVRLTEVKEEIQ